VGKTLARRVSAVALAKAGETVRSIANAGLAQALHVKIELGPVLDVEETPAREAAAETRLALQQICFRGGQVVLILQMPKR